MWLVGCLLQGCAASPGPPRIACGLCEEPDRFVRLQAFPSHTFEDTQRRFAHPFNLQPDEWKIILSNVHVQPIISPNYLSSQLGPVIPVFTTEDVGYLSQTLHLAFPKAQPEDVIVFALSYTGPPQSSEFTTGGWYVEGTKLHLILANYRATVSMSNIREVLDREPLFEIVGSKRFDFVTNEMAQKVSNKSSFLASVLTSETPHLAIEYNMMLGRTGPREPTRFTSEPTAEFKEQNVTTDSSSSIEERLEKLKRLEKKGLITKEDYERKKKELLKQL